MAMAETVYFQPRCPCLGLLQVTYKTPTITKFLMLRAHILHWCLQAKSSSNFRRSNCYGTLKNLLKVYRHLAWQWKMSTFFACFKEHTGVVPLSSANHSLSFKTVPRWALPGGYKKDNSRHGTAPVQFYVGEKSSLEEKCTEGNRRKTTTCHFADMTRKKKKIKKIF